MKLTLHRCSLHRSVCLSLSLSPSLSLAVLLCPLISLPYYPLLSAPLISCYLFLAALHFSLISLQFPSIAMHPSQLISLFPLWHLSVFNPPSPCLFRLSSISISRLSLSFLFCPFLLLTNIYRIAASLIALVYLSWNHVISTLRFFLLFWIPNSSYYDKCMFCGFLH